MAKKRYWKSSPKDWWNLLWHCPEAGDSSQGGDERRYKNCLLQGAFEGMGALTEVYNVKRVHGCDLADYFYRFDLKKEIDGGRIRQIISSETGEKINIAKSGSFVIIWIDPSYEESEACDVGAFVINLSAYSEGKALSGHVMFRSALDSFRTASRRALERGKTKVKSDEG